jgi:Domain of unknown function (DUF4390)
MTARKLWVGTAVWMVAVAVVLAADVKVTPLVVNGQVFASFAAPSAFTSDAAEVVKSGLPLTFTFLVELRRPSTIWFDRTISATTLASSVKFDNLTGAYVVSKLRDGHVTWSERTDKEDEMRGWATSFERVQLEAGEAMEPNVEYYVRVQLRATPRRTFSPFWPFGRDDGSGRADFTFIR